MTAQTLTLNIAVNLGRLGRFALEGRKNRILQFIEDTQIYLEQLETAPKSPAFTKTFIRFKEDFTNLKNHIELTEVWAEEMFTWANILTHRAKLA